MGIEPLWYRPGGFRRVVLVSGHVTDRDGRARERFPESAVGDVRRRIADELDEIGVGPDDLLVCGGARGADLLAAEEALRRGCTVWVLLALPADDFVRTSVAADGTDWEARFWRVLQRAPVWFLDDEPHDAVDDDGVFAAANDWMLRVAHAQAHGEELHVIVVWDGERADGPGGTAEMVDAARATGAEVTVVPPAPHEQGDEPESSSQRQPT